MEEDKLKAKAYDYAVTKKKVNQGVVQAYIDGHNEGYRDRRSEPTIKQLKALALRYNSMEELDYAHGMGDIRRGINAEEALNLKIRGKFDEFIQYLEDIPKNRDIKEKE